MTGAGNPTSGGSSLASRAETSPSRAGRQPFRELTVAQVDRLCADAAAVTFAVPAELAAEFRFRPGQSLTLRRVVDGREERRSYSICSPAGGRPGSGSGRCPAGRFPAGWYARCAPGTGSRCSRRRARSRPTWSSPAGTC